MGRLSYPGERQLRVAEKKERERIKKRIAESEARVERVWNGLPPELIDAPAKPAKADVAGNADHARKKADKEVLVIEKGELPKVAETLRDIIAKSDKFFDRGVPVRITQRAGNKLPIASPLTPHGVVRAAHQLCRPIKDGEYATLPDRVAALYLDMAGEWKLPPLVVISTAPILADDGSIREAEGYDKATGIYCLNVPQLSVPENPTGEQAAASLLILRQAFRTFPFSDAERVKDRQLGVDVIDHNAPMGHDESAFINGLLTGICRQSLWLAPGLLLNAPSISGAGTGKGLLVRAISLIAYGERPRPFTAGNDRHEMDKRLVSEVIEGNPVVFLDNVNGTLLRSNTLASFLTERPSGVRMLGRSQMIRIELATFFAVTGNGLTISEDLARRFIYAAIDAQCEDPEQRPFGPGFLEGIEARRAELVGAALTIWRWGRLNPQPAGITLGSFEKWGKWVRDPLLALGCKDPVARLSEIKARDPERQRVIELFNVWFDKHVVIRSRPVNWRPRLRRLPTRAGTVVNIWRALLATSPALARADSCWSGLAISPTRARREPNTDCCKFPHPLAKTTHPHHPHHPRSHEKMTPIQGVTKTGMARVPLRMTCG